MDDVPAAEPEALERGDGSARRGEAVAPAPLLDRVHLRNCRILPSWDALLEELPKGGMVAEVGVDQGASSTRILTVTRPTKLHLIDLKLGSSVQHRLARAIHSGVVELHEGDSSQVLARFPDGTFDWIFIDGDHSHEGVRKDATVAIKKVKPEGLLVFDDYIFYDHRAHLPYGVIHVVNELCLKQGFELAYLALQQEMFCKAVVRRRRS